MRSLAPARLVGLVVMWALVLQQVVVPLAWVHLPQAQEASTHTAVRGARLRE